MAANRKSAPCDAGELGRWDDDLRSFGAIGEAPAVEHAEQIGSAADVPTNSAGNDGARSALPSRTRSRAVRDEAERAVALMVGRLKADVHAGEADFDDIVRALPALHRVVESFDKLEIQRDQSETLPVFNITFQLGSVRLEAEPAEVTVIEGTATEVTAPAPAALSATGDAPAPINAAPATVALRFSVTPLTDAE